MKTYCRNLEINYDFVWRAYEAWLSSESGHKNAWRVLRQYGSEHNFVMDVTYAIQHRTYDLTPLRFHNEKEANGKLRRIAQLSIKDQLLDYVVITALDPLFKAKIGDTQVASIKGKGPGYGVKLVKRYCQDSTYYIHADIKKCYEYTNTDKLYANITRFIRNDVITTLLLVILSRQDEIQNRFMAIPGLAIGSPLSLKLAQFAISCGYHYIEDFAYYRRGKRIRMFKHQVWYADDLYIFGDSKKHLRYTVEKLNEYFQHNFDFFFKPYKVAKVYSEPVDIAGFVIHETSVTIRDKTYLRIRRAHRRYAKQPTLRNARTVCSYHGQLIHSNSIHARWANQYDAIFKRASAMVSDYDKKVNRIGQNCSNPVHHPSRQGERRIGSKWNAYTRVAPYQYFDRLQRELDERRRWSSDQLYC